MLLQIGLLQSSKCSDKTVRCSCRPPGHIRACETFSGQIVADKRISDVSQEETAQNAPAAVDASASEHDQELQSALADFRTASAEMNRPHKDMHGLFLAAVSRSFEKACEALSQEHSSLLATEQDNARVLNHR